MRHWIIDDELASFDSWREGMPGASVVSREAAKNLSFDHSGIYWCRLRSGEAVTALAGLWPATAVNVVVLADEPSDATTIEVLTGGASGCCNTHAAPEVLQHVAAVVENGGLWVRQSLLLELMGSTSRILARRPSTVENPLCDRLSERELQVARLVATGASNKEVARQLVITERTVKAHLTAIFEKFEIRDRLQLSLKINGTGTK